MPHESIENRSFMNIPAEAWSQKAIIGPARSLLHLLRAEFLRRKMRFVLEAMREDDVDLWLTFTREGNEDPVAADLRLGGLTWRSAGLIWSDGDTEALVGSYESETVRQRSFYDRVYGYGKEGAAQKLKELVSKRKPRKVAVNTSFDFGLADGLSTGMHRYLKKSLEGFGGRLTSSEDMVVALRARLVPEEVELISRSIEICEKIYELAEREFIKPGRTDAELHHLMLSSAKEMGVAPAWPEDHCPSVLVGSLQAGHVGYHNVVLRRGDFLKLDFGVEYQGYCSDVQRCYVVGGSIKADMAEMFRTAKDANEACLIKLKPGIPGYVADEASREVVISRGYPEFMHATGHTLGRTTHEIGPLLGPRWRWRYGRSPERRVQADMVFTVEPSVAGKLGTCNLEQDVLVTSNGYKPLSRPQEELTVIGG
jgi:Xaa-Pro aminopeptidase